MFDYTDIMSPNTTTTNLLQMKVSFLHELRDYIRTYIQMLSQFDHQASKKVAHAWAELSQVFEVYLSVLKNASSPQVPGHEATSLLSPVVTTPHQSPGGQNIDSQVAVLRLGSASPMSSVGFPVDNNASISGTWNDSQSQATQLGATPERATAAIAQSSHKPVVSIDNATIPSEDDSLHHVSKLLTSLAQKRISCNPPSPYSSLNGTMISPGSEPDTFNLDLPNIDQSLDLVDTSSSSLEIQTGASMNPRKSHDEHRDVIFRESDITVTDDGVIPVPEEKKFDTRDDALEYVHKHAYQYGYQISISNSAFRDNCHGLHTKYFTQEEIARDRDPSNSKNSGHPRTYIQFKCTKRHAPVADRPLTRQFPRHGTGCGFTLYISLRPSGWTVKVTNSDHNHKQDFGPESLSRATRIPEDVRDFTWDMIEQGQCPRQIMDAIATQYGGEYNVTYDEIYAEVRYYRKRKFGFLSRAHEAMRLLMKEECKYRYAVDQSNCITHMFFAHQESIALARTFPSVVLVGCADRKDRRDMPLVNILGINNYLEPFTIAVAFIADESESSFEWVLRQLHQLYDAHELPKVIMTDRDRVLDNLIVDVFGTTTCHILCHQYIRINVADVLSRLVSEEAVREEATSIWENVMDAQTEREHCASWSRLEHTLKDYPEAYSDLQEQWMPQKGKFVQAYVGNIFHLNMVSSKRMESIFARLKSDSRAQYGNIYTFAKLFVDTAERRIRKYKQRILDEHSKSPRNEFIANRLYRLLLNKVTTKCLSLLDEQRKLGEDASLTQCTGTFTKRMGLPCSHKIKEFVETGTSIALSDIHKHWWLDPDRVYMKWKARNEEYVGMIVRYASTLSDFEKEKFYASILETIEMQWKTGKPRKIRRTTKKPKEDEEFFGLF